MSFGRKKQRLSLKRRNKRGPLAQLGFRRKRTTQQMILEELERQGLKAVDYSSARLGRFVACVMMEIMSNPLPVAVAKCIKRQITPFRTKG